MEARAHGWDVQVLDITEHMSLLSVQGPQSRTILQQVTDEDLSNEAFPFSTHKVITIAGHQARALRLTFVGEMGNYSWLFVDVDDGWLHFKDRSAR